MTAPGFANFLVIASGWLLTEGTHAVTEALVMTDVAARRHHEGFHRFFSRGTWSPDLLGRWIFGRIRNSLGEAGVVRIVLNDTLAPKKGPHVFGIGSHLDAVRSTKKQKVLAFGHCWVLEEMRLLTNYAMDSQNRLRVLFCGQTELRRRLTMAVHEPLAQRIVVRYQLGPPGRTSFGSSPGLMEAQGPTRLRRAA